jgi:hypothetical protein
LTGTEYSSTKGEARALRLFVELEFAGLDALQIPVASSQWSVVSIG